MNDSRFSTTFFFPASITPGESEFVIDSVAFPPHHHTISAAGSESSWGPFVLQGKLFTEGRLDADEEKGKEKEETLSEALPRMGPKEFFVPATAGTFLLRRA